MKLSPRLISAASPADPKLASLLKPPVAGIALDGFPHIIIPIADASEAAISADRDQA